MDLKSISWAGNIYEKFEAMCLEVEEVIYEDTMKYMENQVQKVGASVKKFYSEVMHDLLPPSCMDPMKMDAVNLSPNPSGEDDVSKKSLKGLRKKEIKNENLHDPTPEESFPHPSPTVSVETTGSGLCSAKSKVGLQRRSIGIKRISKADLPPIAYSPMTDTSKHSSDSIAQDTRRVCTVDKNATVDTEYVKPESISVSDALEKSVASDNKLSAEPLRLKKDDSECTSSFSGYGVKDTSFFTSSKDKLMKDGSLSCNTCAVESLDKETIVSYEESLDMELVDKEEVAESVEGSKLEDTCILIASDLLHFVPLEAKKNKPCKKNFSEPLSAKLRPKMNQNNADGVILDCTNDSNYINVPAQYSFESDWELI